VASPRAETTTDFISMATDERLEFAAALAIQEMADSLAGAKELARQQAYQLVGIGAGEDAEEHLPAVVRLI